jgi:hypothetical protein
MYRLGAKVNWENTSSKFRDLDIPDRIDALEISKRTFNSRFLNH